MPFKHLETPQGLRRFPSADQPRFTQPLHYPARYPKFSCDATSSCAKRRSNSRRGGFILISSLHHSESLHSHWNLWNQWVGTSISFQLSVWTLHHVCFKFKHVAFMEWAFPKIMVYLYVFAWSSLLLAGNEETWGDTMLRSHCWMSFFWCQRQEFARGRCQMLAGHCVSGESCDFFWIKVVTC